MLYLLKSSENSTKNVWKIGNRPSRRKFFKGMELFFKNFDFSKICQNKLDHNNEKIIYSVSLIHEKPSEYYELKLNGLDSA